MVVNIDDNFGVSISISTILLGRRYFRADRAMLIKCQRISLLKDNFLTKSLLFINYALMAHC